MLPKLNTANQSGQSPASAPALLLALGLALTGYAAEPPTPARPPRLTTLVPPGVAIGGLATWTFEGHDLAGVDRIDIEGDGVSAVIKARQDGSVVAEARAEPGAKPGFRAVWVEGPTGISNVRVVRVDHLGQTAETEGNDTPSEATFLPEGRAGVGTLSPRDVDHFRVVGKKGQRVAVELEARRLGLAVAPVLTIMTPDGRALAQGRETPGVGGDCRVLYTFPADGAYVVQVRDNLFGGSDGGYYRLRVGAEPFATALFPLGGPPSRPITVTASGGNLAAPLSQTVELPDRPGADVEVPPFPTAQGPVVAPGRLVVGDGPEVTEKADGVMALSDGVTVNARIDRPGEIDRFRIGVKAGRVVRVKVVAARLGSWLDSVVTIRDSRGNRRAENDDKVGPDPRPGVEADPDSRLDFQADADEDLTVEVTDRFGRGGVEFGYRLSEGDPRPDFTVLARPFERWWLDPDGEAVGTLWDRGAYHWKPGESLSIACEIEAEGRTGPITIRAVGLPEGVTSSPVIAYPRASRPEDGAGTGFGRVLLTLRADNSSAGVSGRFRVVATALPPNGRPLEREATLGVLINTVFTPGETRLLFKGISEFPLRVTVP